MEIKRCVKYSIIICIFLFILECILFSYNSYYLDCEYKGEINSNIIGGYFNPLTNEIFIYSSSENNFVEPNDTINFTEKEIRTIKHELIHQRQLEQERLYNCSNKYGVILNEFEAYFFSIF